jgi:hypothetical protein
MRARWGYLQPQIRKLMKDEEQIAPVSSHKYVKVNKPHKVIHGNVNDINHFDAFHAKKSQKLINVQIQSQKMETDRQEKLNQYYIPSPCVRY